jgi:hypothetical protein
MKLFIVTLISVFSFSAFAGDAGCGLGSVVISKNSKLLQLFAMTTNGTFLSQAFGITSGTSNCSSSGLVMNDKQMQYFVEVNQEDLSREMAQGHGDKLATLALLNGCADTGSQKAFANFTQQSYSKIIPSASVTSMEMVSNLKAQMGANTELTQMCHGS